jgi:hypothetical protein
MRQFQVEAEVHQQQTVGALVVCLLAVPSVLNEKPSLEKRLPE